MNHSINGSEILDTSNVSENKANNSKRDIILKACIDNDLQTLISCADEEGGLIDDELRRSACKRISL